MKQQRVNIALPSVLGSLTFSFSSNNEYLKFFKPILAILNSPLFSKGYSFRKDTDVAPYIAFGRILTKIVGGVYKYKVEYLSKVKFKDTMPDEATKGESIEFTTVSIEGSVMRKTDVLLFLC